MKTSTPIVPLPKAAYSTKREQDLIALYNKGWSGAETFLRTAFGGAIPRDLTIVNAPDYNIEYKNFLSDPLFFLSTAIETFRNNWGKLGFLYFFNMPRMAVALTASSLLWSFVKLRGYVRPHYHPERVHISDIWAAVRYFDRDNEGLANTVAHEGWHTMQAFDGRMSLSSAFNENRIGMKWLFPKEMSSWMKYLSSEAELGARMFTTISNAYVQHGIMPQTKHELWACLISQGLQPPQAVLNFVQTCPDCAAAFAKFPTVMDYVKDHADASAARDLNRVNDGLDDEAHRFKLWDKLLPFIYGDILEVMGDRFGHKRMGHTHNIQLREIFMKAAQGHMNKESEHAAAFETLTETAAKMCVDDARTLLTLLASGFPYKEMNAEQIGVPEGATRLLAVLALARHPEMKRGEAERILYETTGLRPQEWQEQMKHPGLHRIRTINAATRRLRDRLRRTRQQTAVPDYLTFA